MKKLSLILELYNKLNSDQKMKLNTISLEYIRLRHIQDRPSPIDLIKSVMDTNISYNYSDDFVEKNQLRLLNKEIEKYRNEKN